MSIEATTALKPDIYPVVAAILVPGFIVAAPWAAGVFWPELQLPITWEGTTMPIAVTLLGITLVFGFVLEDVGSRVETFLADRWLKAKHTALSENWDAYLALKTDSEIVGQRYLRAIQLRFKFELSMLPACLCSGAGLLTSQWLGHGLGWPKVLAISAAIVALSFYLKCEIRGSALVLAKTRAIVIEACKPKA